MSHTTNLFLQFICPLKKSIQLWVIANIINKSRFIKRFRQSDWHHTNWCRFFNENTECTKWQVHDRRESLGILYCDITISKIASDIMRACITSCVDTIPLLRAPLARRVLCGRSLRVGQGPRTFFWGGELFYLWKGKNEKLSKTNEQLEFQEMMVSSELTLAPETF